MKKIKYEMLVRDNVPSLIEESGRTVIVERAKPEEIQDLLRFKLHETLNQYDNSQDILDLIKCLEVIDAIAVTHGISPTTVLKMKDEMRNKKGGYHEMLVLKEISYE